jgi:NADPH:quinone reductase-like Zn-dependent oxidoreductase
VASRWIAPQFGGIDVLTIIDEDVPAPGPGEVTIEVRAAGMNPIDFKILSGGPDPDPSRLPLKPGFELAGVVTALGPGAELASGGGAVGDEVLAFRVTGGYATALNVTATDVFAKPATIGFPEAANLLLAGTTAADMLNTTRVGAGDTVLVHGASGAVGVSAIQQARLLGARVIGTASESHFDVVRRFGGEPVAYGDGLLDRVRALAPAGVDQALDCVGTDEAVDVSLALVSDRTGIVSIAAYARATAEGIALLGGASPASADYRAANRARLIGYAAAGDLVVPVARTFAFTEAVAALRLLATGHAGGKLALVPWSTVD